MESLKVLEEWLIVLIKVMNSLLDSGKMESLLKVGLGKGKNLEKKNDFYINK